MIETKNLIKSYSSRTVVDNVSISVGPGEIVGLLGPNGAGKTTTFYMVVGLVRPDQGRVFLNHNDITDLPIHRRARRGIGYLPQQPSIFRKLTVEENILALWELMPSVPKEEYKSKLDALLEEIGLTHIRKSRGFQLSGGEQRRVEIARALATNPSFILLDEPFSGIDPITVDDLQKTIKYLRDKGLGILITDHNVRETLAITDRAYILHKGKILVAGNSAEVAENEIAKKFYLGEEFSLD
jgi:lipopolysaccharide export system ATP-binding protein